MKEPVWHCELVWIDQSGIWTGNSWIHEATWCEPETHYFQHQLFLL